MSKTTWQKTFRGSPRFKLIAHVFALIDDSTATINLIERRMNRVMQGLNSEERDRLPALVREKLVNREPVRVAPVPMV